MTRANKKSVSMTTNWGNPAITERSPMVEAKMMTVKKSRMVLASKTLLLPVMPSVSAHNTPVPLAQKQEKQGGKAFHVIGIAKLKVQFFLHGTDTVFDFRAKTAVHR